MLRAVLFDFSGTLVHCGDAWWQLELQTTVRAPLTLLQERGLTGDAPIDLERADSIYATLRRSARDTAVEVSAYAAVRQAAAGLGLTIADGAIEAAVDDLFRSCLADITPVAGAHETLLALSAQDLILAVISNARHGAFVRWALERLDMAHFFRAIVVSADVQLRKPQPAIFLNTLASLGVAPAAAAFVGDYHPYDMVGAQAAGLRTVWLVESGKPPDNLAADLIISRLPELAAALPHL